MPRYDIRLEAQDGSGHFRIMSPEAKDKTEAQRIAERKEFELAAFQIDVGRQADLCERYGVDSIDDLPKAPPLGADEEKRAAWKAIPERGLLHAHYQEQPYKVVSVTARKGK